MLEFIIGRAGSGKTHACIEAMRERMEAAPLGPALVLLLPEHMTYQAERELASSMPKGRGFMRSYVFGFRRFARQVLLETGGMVHPRITDVGRNLLLKRILDRRKDELGAFRRAASQRGFSHALSEGIQELKSYSLDAGKLAETAGKVDEPQLRGKLRDLSLLVADFCEAMKGRYNDHEDMMAALTERLSGAKFLKGAEVWVDGFIFFNPQERCVLGELMKMAASVHVTLAMDADLGSPENLRQTGTFHRSWETMQALQDLAGRFGIPTRVRHLEGFPRGREVALCQIERQLFAFPPEPVSVKKGIFIVEAAVRRLEAEAAASDILRLCREEGYRYRDIGVLIREETYGSLMDFVLEEHGIPFFRDGKRSAAHHPLAELVRSSFEAVRGWRYEPVFRCLRTGFFPVTWDQLDRLENYVLEFGIRGEKRWLMEEDWSWRRRGLEDERGQTDGKTARILQEINFARRQTAGTLSLFQEEVKSAKNAKELTEALYNFLAALHVPERLEEWAELAEKEGRLAAAMEHRQIWDDVISLMDQLVEVSGEEKMSPKEYEEVLREGLEALEIALIPPGLDYVSVAPFDQNSLGNSRAIYILGANEGVMPRRSKGKGLFTDAERLHLMEAGMEISSGGLEGSLAEKYLIYRGFTESREYLWVSYSLADAAGDGLAPSSLVGRIRRMLPEAEFLSIPLESLALQEQPEQGEALDRLSVLRLADGRQALSGLTAVLRRRRDRQECLGLWKDVYNWLLGQEDLRLPREAALSGLFAKADSEKLPEELALRIFAKHRRLRGSVTRFERFHSCPFQHFAQYGLRLQERREYRFQALDLGTLLHSMLREFGEGLKAAGRRWRDVGEKEACAMCQVILEKLVPRLRNELLMSTAQYKHQQERIRSVAERSIRRLVALDAVSQFHPQVYESSFGGSMSPLSYVLGRDVLLEITGQIDRMDIAEDGRYFLIIDYKTGNSAINLLEVYYGLRMQLLTYLLVARNLLARAQGEDMLPAGMLYFFLKYPMYTSAAKIGPEQAKKEIEKKLRMPGWILADPEVVRAIDSSQKFIKVRLTKSGGIHSADRSKVKTEEEFAVLLDYVDALLESTGRSILSGDIAARPYRWKDRVPCSFCPYRAVCGFDLKLEGFEYEKLEEHDNDWFMGKMKERGGSCGNIV